MTNALNLKDEIKPNTQQQECIEKHEGQYLVLAGPGTGKTFTVSRRIENMVKKGIDPQKILCLTFSDIAATQMKTKIDERLGKIESDVNVYTYHSFCNDILSNNLEEFDLPENYRLISTTVERNFVNECIDELGDKVQAYRSELNDPYKNSEDILKGIHAIKQNRLKKDKYFYNLEYNIEWMPLLNQYYQTRQTNYWDKGKEPTVKLKGLIQKQEQKIAKAKELWTFYELYQAKMAKYHFIDYNDMISLVLDKFEEDEGFLASVASDYEYLLVDEYQDTNPAQNDVVLNLCKGMVENSKGANVFVVGDDDQIVFTFQGARLDTMERFLREFPDTKVICLKENMRSTQKILDAARGVATQDDKRLENNKEFEKYEICKELVAKNEKLYDKNDPVRFYTYVDGLQEQLEIVKEIETLVNSDKCPQKDGKKCLSEIAILTKSNRELESYAELLKARNIECELKEGKNIFQIKSAMVMFYYMEMLVNPELHADKIFRILLNPPFDISLKDYKTLYEIKSNHKAFLDCIREGLNGEIFEDSEKLAKFIKTYDELRNFSPNENLKTIVLEIGAKTGIFNHYLNTAVNRCENIAGLKKLVDVAKSYSELSMKTLEDFVDYLETCLIDDVEIKTDKAPVDMNAIQLSTYHSSKGKEYEYVYMPSLFNTKLEDYKKPNCPIVPLNPKDGKTPEEYQEKRISDCVKTIYVGMTRAKYALRLSYFSKTGPRTHLTKFISNIQDILEREPEPFEYDENSYWQEMTQTILKQDYDYEKDFASIVDMRLKDRVYSVSFLNEYKKCPRSFLYSKILGFDSTAEIPDAMNYGSAIHNTLEECLKYALEKGHYPTKEEMIEEFKKQMRKQKFSSYAQRVIMEGRGIDSLERYYHHFTNTSISSIDGAEEQIDMEVDGYKFTGKIDRVEKNEDGTFTIIDYKTGKAKTKSVIGLGKEHEDYYNQIGFYKYLFEKKHGVTVSKTKFIFPDFPDEKPCEIEFTPEQCEAIKDEYIRVINEIKSYKFDPVEDRDPNKFPCKFCTYYKTCHIDMM